MTNSSKKLSIEYIIALLYTILGFGLIAFALYLLPFIFNYNYQVPAFIENIRADLEMAYGIHGNLNMLLLLIPLLVMGILFLFLAKKLTTQVEIKEARPDDNLILELTKKQPVEEKNYKVHPVIFHLLFILIGLSLLLLIEWILSHYY